MRRWAIGAGAALAIVAGLACGSPRVKVADSPETQVDRRQATAPAPAKVLLNRYEYTIDESGNAVVKTKLVYRILNQEGVEGWGRVEARWAPWHMDRPELDVTVTDPTGKRSTLDPATISDAPAYPDAPEIYSDARLLRAPLPGIVPGSEVDERTTTRMRPFVGGSDAHFVWLTSGVPHERVEVVIDLPDDMPFNHEVRDAELKLEEQREGGRRRLTFSGGPYPALEGTEPLVPYDVAPYPYLAFATGPGWAALARHYSDLVDRQLEGLDFSEIVAGRVDPSDDRDTKIAKLLAWMHKRVRYAAIEFGETAVLPRNPTDTLERGYGDCKDKATLLVGLLRAAGIDAHVALLRAGFGHDVRPNLPALSLFNHAIVHVAGEPGLWIDPTDPFARAGDLPPSDAHRHALIASRATEGLVQTPAPNGKADGYREVRVVELPDFGPARIREHTEATGFIERDLRRSFDQSEQEQRKSAERYVERSYGGAELTDVSVSPIDDLSKPFAIEIDMKGARVAVTDLVIAAASLDSRVLFSWLPSPLLEGEPRTTDLLLPTPHHIELRYEIHPPSGFVPDALPAPRNRVLGPAALDRRIETGPDGVVRVSYRFAAEHHRWTPAEVESFRKAYEKLQEEGERSVVMLHEGEVAARKRDAKGSIAAYRRLAEAHPESGVHRMRLAVALSSLGMGHAARHEALAAVELSPKEAHLHVMAGDILGRDLLGRDLLSRTYEKRQRAAYERALAVDPSYTRAKVALALLEEYDDLGRRYTAESHLDRAVAAYDAIPEEELAELDDGDYAYNALFALVYAGRFRELSERLGRLGEGQQPPVLAILAAALDGDPEQAIARARRLELSDEDRNGALESAAATLLHLRRYPESAALSRAVGEAVQQPAAILAAKLRGSLKPVDPTTMKATTPAEAASRAFTYFSSRPEEAERHLADLVSPRAFDAEGKSVVTAFLGGLSQGFASYELPAAVIGDLMAGGYKASVVGDADGHRVTMRATMNDFEVPVFIVDDGGKLRIRAIGAFMRGDLGCEGLYLQQRGRRTGAGHWLQWADEQAPKAPSPNPLLRDPYTTLRSDGADQELAAAALCASGTQVAPALAVLEKARASASGDRLTAIELALLAGQVTQKNRAGQLAVAERLEAAFPGYAQAHLLVDEALLAAGKHSELRRRLSSRPDTYLYRDLRAKLAIEEAKFDEARAHYEAALSLEGVNRGATHSAIAWLSLFANNADAAALEHAQRAAQLEPQRVRHLGVVASLQAELGRLHDARQTLDLVLGMRRHGTPEPEDWWIVG
ncbi:MAG: DUF3857 domain-containing protein, partial [Myxococcales bacterium]|nr:DUF3857 domain-containing protein [Myxococcales bacterium]